MVLCPCFGSWLWRIRLRPYNQDADDGVHGPSPTNVNAGATIREVDLEVGRLGSEVEDLKAKGHQKVRIFDYRELATATRDFREECILGEGGFGTVYRGRLRDTGQEVAVKQLNKSGHQGEKEFSVEVLMLSLLRHKNLVNLLGYCAEGDQRLLVYEYMALGSLEDHLHGLVPDVGPLNWNTRMKIATGAAKGLNYLHNETEPPVIYRDLKAANILLDNAFQPKLSDFGLAKFGPVGDLTHVSTRVMGTQGYCAPEYGLSGKLTMKTDVYSFGVVLLELITGRRAVELVDGHSEYLVEWVRPRIKDTRNVNEFADSMLHGQFSEDILRRVANIACMCVREDPGGRPSIKEVMLALEYLADQKFDHVATGGDKDDDPERSPKTVLKEDTKVRENELEREKAVAEAKRWGETWREKRRQVGENNPTALDR